MKKKVLLAVLVLFLSGCYSPTPEQKCGLGQACGDAAYAPGGAVKYFANEEDVISLQNLTTRVVVHCYTTQTELAETCAQAFEKHDFVRFRDIPYKTANYDFLKKDTYPVRRWRSGERTPRW